MLVWSYGARLDGTANPSRFQDLERDLERFQESKKVFQSANCPEVWGSGRGPATQD